MKDSDSFNTRGIKNKKKVPVQQESFTSYTKNVIRNRREKDYTGNYCKTTFRKYRDFKEKLNKEELGEFIEELYIENPRETEKIFNSLEVYDVIGCIKFSRPHHPKSYLVINKNKEEQTLEVIPWQYTWLDNPIEKVKLSIREFQHQFKNINLENRVSIEDLGLSLSLGLFVKLYKFNKKEDTFNTPDSDVRKVRIITVIKQESPENNP